MKYFYGSFVITVIGLGLAFFIGGYKALYITILLSMLEISLSFDNAVINAKILSNMNRVWIRRFITYGMIIAVFGMRLIFPLLIVYFVSGLEFIQTINIAFNDHTQYEEILISQQKLIFAFGGSFLLMVFLDFLFEKREINWIKIIESSKINDKLSLFESIELVIALVVGLLIAHYTSELNIIIAYIYGILLYSVLSSLDKMFSTSTIRNGLMGFLYLEVLDASFSFDGVIGAFALSSNILIIMLGLGIGAMFVRSLTIYFVYSHTLTKYKYLEHGAHYAIGILAFIMLFKIFVHIDELIVGTLSIILVLSSLAHSILENKRLI